MTDILYLLANLVPREGFTPPPSVHFDRIILLIRRAGHIGQVGLEANSRSVFYLITGLFRIARQPYLFCYTGLGSSQLTDCPRSVYPPELSVVMCYPSTLCFRGLSHAAACQISTWPTPDTVAHLSQQRPLSAGGESLSRESNSYFQLLLQMTV